MPANVRIVAKNLADAVYGGTIAASPAMVSASLAETNLQKPTERARVARTSSTAAQRLTLDLTAAAAVNTVAFTRHNWSTAATLRVRAQSAVGSPSTQLFDSGAVSAFSTAGLAAIETYTDGDFRGLKNTVQYFGSQVSPEWIFDIADAANADGYIEQTRLFLGTYFQFTYDPPFGGIDFTYSDSSVGERSHDGSLIVDKGWKARKIVLQLDFITDADLPTVLAIARFMGKHGECWLDCYPDDTGAKGMYHRGAFRLTDSPTFNPWQVGLHKNTMTFEET